MPETFKLPDTPQETQEKPSPFSAAGLFSEATSYLFKRDEKDKPTPENKPGTSAADTGTRDNRSVDAQSSLPKMEITASKPAMPDLEVLKPAGEIARKFAEAGDPVAEVTKAVERLDSLKYASITQGPGGSHHIEASLEQSHSVKPPDVVNRGFRPLTSTVGTEIAFDVKNVGNGILLSHMNGFSGTVRGPLGRVRETDTTSMLLGKDSKGEPFLQTTSDVHFRRRSRSGTTVLRENDFPQDSPMRAVMRQPEAITNMTGALRMFQSTDDIQKASIKKLETNKFEVRSEFKDSRHIELNHKLEDSPATVKAIDLEKALTATFKKDESGVKLENIKGIKVDVELGPLKLKLEPTQVALQKDKNGIPVVRLELTTPQGQKLPVEVPVSKLMEQKNKKSR